MDGIPDKGQLVKMVKRFQEIARIQDWDVFVELYSDAEMNKECGMEFIPAGFCTRYREHKKAIVMLNIEAEQWKENWYYVFLHELHHIVFDDMDYEIEGLLDYMPDKVAEKHRADIKVKKERFVCMLAKEFANACSADRLVGE